MARQRCSPSPAPQPQPTDLNACLSHRTKPWHSSLATGRPSVSLFAMRLIVARRNGKQIVQFRGPFHQLDADGFELLGGGQMRAVARKPHAALRLLAQVRCINRYAVRDISAGHEGVSPWRFQHARRVASAEIRWSIVRPRLGHEPTMRSILPRYWLCSHKVPGGSCVAAVAQKNCARRAGPAYFPLRFARSLRLIARGRSIARVRNRSLRENRCSELEL